MDAFEVMMKNSTEKFVPDYYVYTDGSCMNNGSPDAVAGMGIWFGESDSRNVSEKVEGKQSNNTAELGAFIRLYSIIADDIIDGKKIGIVSDSYYAITCVTGYGETCSKNNWKKNIPNKDIVKTAYELYRDKKNIRFIQVKGHSGNTDPHSIGNDGADKLANKAIGLERCPYSKIYLNVPFSKKDDAKMLGAKWDNDRKMWYILDNYVNKDAIVERFKVVHPD